MSAQAYNQNCHCIGLAEDVLHTSLQPHVDLPLPANLFAEYPVFLADATVRSMQAAITAIEAIVSSSPYRDWAKQTTSAPWPDPDNASFGVFTSYDFHLSDNGPKLIEVNTNAGGAILGAHLAAAQRYRTSSCCELDTPSVTAMQQKWLTMFQSEWRACRTTDSPRTLAIVDDRPDQQFLYPEFQLAKAMFEQSGITTHICSPDELHHADDHLVLKRNGMPDEPIGMVYNRLTDFYLATPASAALRQAYLANTAIITPSPVHHALRANKRAMTFWSDPKRLNEIPLTAAERSLLQQVVPYTRLVDPANEQALWAERKQLFFKPLDGYASRGVYEGRKLTRKKWSEIMASDYIAQAQVTPSQRLVPVDGQMKALKADIRCLTYGKEIQQITARLYQGQTTNLRTAGGGIASVIQLAG